MDVEDDIREGLASSIILQSLESTQQGDKLSDEDLAWVNSCLVTDTEILERNWSSFKDVLLEIIGDQPEPLDSSATGSNGFLSGTEISIVPAIKEAEAANYSGRTDEDLLVIPVDGDNGINTNNIPIKKRTGTQLQFLQEDSAEMFWGDPFRPTYKENERKDSAVDSGVKSSLSAEEMNSSTADIFRVWDLDIPVDGDNGINTNNIPIKKRTGTELQFLQEDSTEVFRGDPFRPTYKENERKDSAADSGVKSSLSAEEMNSSTVDIFRVWELDIPDEEDDLIKELNEVSAETTTSFPSMPLPFDDSTALKDLEDETLDNLIAGIADLSLNPEKF
ncbi:hypothetical protein Goshw_018190 [Gossypium schwendimanii]|uniref:Uncharacterized protein n=1 Tax=Gossypium schwendimanii TaxID=34291 RepID=A0A7J9LWL4_GOSSC|nr:hypothetical protein [Gossypium schwendimanii]